MILNIPEPVMFPFVSRVGRTGLAAGMVLPDPADKSLETVRVTAAGTA